MSVVGLGFGEQFADARRRPLADVCFNVVQRESKACADRRGDVLGVDRCRELIRCYAAFEHIKIDHNASYKIAKPGRVPYLPPRFWLDMAIERCLVHRRAERPATWAISSAIKFRFANKRLIHESYPAHGRWEKTWRLARDDWRGRWTTMSLRCLTTNSPGVAPHHIKPLY